MSERWSFISWAISYRWPSARRKPSRTLRTLPQLSDSSGAASWQRIPLWLPAWPASGRRQTLSAGRARGRSRPVRSATAPPLPTPQPPWRGLLSSRSRRRSVAPRPSSWRSLCHPGDISKPSMPSSLFQTAVDRKSPVYAGVGFRLELQVDRVQQVVLAGKVGKEGSFGNACAAGDLRRGHAKAGRRNLSPRRQNGLSLLRAFPTRPTSLGYINGRRGRPRREHKALHFLYA